MSLGDDITLQKMRGKIAKLIQLITTIGIDTVTFIWHTFMSERNIPAVNPHVVTTVSGSPLKTGDLLMIEKSISPHKDQRGAVMVCFAVKVGKPHSRTK